MQQLGCLDLQKRPLAQLVVAVRGRARPGIRGVLRGKEGGTYPWLFDDQCLKHGVFFSFSVSDDFG